MSVAKQLVVSVHDVAPPHWDRTRRMLDALASVGVDRRSLLVIPDYHRQGRIDENEAFCQWLRERQDAGDELVLHGYEHLGVGCPTSARERLKNRWLTQGEGEFLSLGYDQARERIRLGSEVLARARLRSQGFIAPAWLINQAGLRAARDAGFQYTNSYWRFTDLAAGGSRFAPSLVFGPGHLNEDLGVRVQGWMVGLLTRSPVVRVVLHPPCIDAPARFRRILPMIEMLTGSHQVVTYQDLLASFREERIGDDGRHLAS